MVHAMPNLLLINFNFPHENFPTLKSASVLKGRDYRHNPTSRYLISPGHNQSYRTEASGLPSLKRGENCDHIFACMIDFRTLWKSCMHACPEWHRGSMHAMTSRYPSLPPMGCMKRLSLSLVLRAYKGLYLQQNGWVCVSRQNSLSKGFRIRILMAAPLKVLFPSGGKHVHSSSIHLYAKGGRPVYIHMWSLQEERERKRKNPNRVSADVRSFVRSFPM